VLPGVTNAGCHREAVGLSADGTQWQKRAHLGEQLQASARLQDRAGEYVNLKGKEGRDHSLLPTLQGEYRLNVDWGALKAIPLRFATGYLPRNGPVARASAGLLFPLSPTVDLVAELLSLMVWVTNDQTLFSMNVAVELVIGMGP